MPAPPDEPEPDDVPAEDADLVAYLDGEADPAAARKVADEIAGNASVRSKAEALKKTYDLLDYLSKPETSSTFTTRTLTRLDALSGLRPEVRADAPEVRRPRYLQWIALGLAALIFGAITQRVLSPYLIRPAEPDLADKPIIDRLPLYAGVDDLSFAQRLAASDLFGGDVESDNLAPQAVVAVTSAQWSDRAEIFRKYSHERRLQLRTLHRDLTDLPEDEQRRLFRVLEAYAGWLTRLPEAERREVLESPNGDARLAAVRQVYNRQWEGSLPASQREKLNLTTNADERIRLVKEWRDREHDRRLEWQLAARQWAALSENRKPWPFSDDALAREVDAFVKAVFKPDGPVSAQRLAPAELTKLKALQAATGQNVAWLPYGAFVLQLSEKYATLPESPNGSPIIDLEQLPPKLQADVRGKFPVPRRRYAASLGKWPSFALSIAQEFRPYSGEKPLGPCQPGDFAKPVVEFLILELIPKLTPAEARRLDLQKGKWPEYPRLMIDLAKAKDLSVPGVTLPGKPSLWAKYYRYTPAKEDGTPEK